MPDALDEARGVLRDHVDVPERPCDELRRLLDDPLDHRVGVEGGRELQRGRMERRELPEQAHQLRLAGWSELPPCGISDILVTIGMGRGF